MVPAVRVPFTKQFRSGAGQALEEATHGTHRQLRSSAVREGCGLASSVPMQVCHTQTVIATVALFTLLQESIAA